MKKGINKFIKIEDMSKPMTLKFANDSIFGKENKNEFCIGDKHYRYEGTVQTTRKCSEGIMTVDLVVAFNHQTCRYTIFDLSKKNIANKKVAVIL